MTRYLPALLALLLFTSCDSFFEKESVLPHNPERPELPPARDRRFVVDSIQYHFDYWSRKSTQQADEICLTIFSNSLDSEWHFTPTLEEPLYNYSCFSSEDPVFEQIYTDTLLVRTPCYVDDDNRIILGDSLYSFQQITQQTLAEIDRTGEETIIPPHTETYFYGRYSITYYDIAYTIWLTEMTSQTPTPSKVCGKAVSLTTISRYASSRTRCKSPAGTATTSVSVLKQKSLLRFFR